MITEGFEMETVITQRISNFISQFVSVHSWSLDMLIYKIIVIVLTCLV